MTHFNLLIIYWELFICTCSMPIMIIFSSLGRPNRVKTPQMYIKVKANTVMQRFLTLSSIRSIKSDFPLKQQHNFLIFFFLKLFSFFFSKVRLTVWFYWNKHSYFLCYGKSLGKFDWFNNSCSDDTLLILIISLKKFLFS